MRAASLNDDPAFDSRVRQTPLHHACIYGQRKCALALLNHGAGIEGIETWRETLEACDGWGYTPLHLAATWGHIDCVVVLLERGAEPDAVDNKGMTPRYYALQQGFPRIATMLDEETKPAQNRYLRWVKQEWFTYRWLKPRVKRAFGFALTEKEEGVLTRVAEKKVE